MLVSLSQVVVIKQKCVGLFRPIGALRKVGRGRFFFKGRGKRNSKEKDDPPLSEKHRAQTMPMVTSSSLYEDSKYAAVRS